MKWLPGVGLPVVLLTTGWIISGLIIFQNDKSTAGLPSDHVVEVRQMAFVPSSITVRKGDRITFINRDIVMHDIAEKKKAWQSHPLATGKSWTLTVMQSADYYCSIHPVMKGKIILK